MLSTTVVEVVVDIEEDSVVVALELSADVVIVGAGSATRETTWQFSVSLSPKTINNCRVAVRQNVAVP